MSDPLPYGWLERRGDALVRKPATIGMQMEPQDPLDRKLAELNARIARLERRQVIADADVAKGRRLLGDLLVLLGRRLRDE